MLVTCVLAGTIGFRQIEGWNTFESFYMTIISITTVGYGELRPLSQAGRVFASVIILTGLGSTFFATTMLGRVILESEFRGTFERMRMHNKLAKLDGHSIVCGYGRTGKVVVEELRADGFPFCVVESNRSLEDELRAAGHPFVIGDATDETVLEEAGIRRAQTLMSLLSSDADNLYLCIMSKEMNPKINVVARALDDQAERRLLRGGANHVVATYRIAGHRVYRAAMRPAVSEFFELASNRQQLSLIVEEIRLGGASILAGRSIREANPRAEFGVIIIAVKSAAGQMQFNPDPGLVLNEGDTLIAMGEKTALARLTEACKQPSRT